MASCGICEVRQSVVQLESRSSQPKQNRSYWVVAGMSLWFSWACDGGITQLVRKIIICRKCNVNSLLLLMAHFLRDKLLRLHLVTPLQLRAAASAPFMVLEGG